MAADATSESRTKLPGGSTGNAGTAPAVRLVDRYLSDAVAVGASDLHLEPDGGRLLVRARIDGELHPLVSPPTSLEAPVLARLRILARVDLAEHRLPLDGRFVFHSGREAIEIRAAFMPVHGGEKVALRLLRGENSWVSIRDLGMDPEEERLFQQALDEPSGMHVVAGPTGSGKTTTLYATLETLRKPRLSIVTAEDPVERDLAGIAQIPVDDECGRSFAVVLRAILRLDPDVLMIGEVRDAESARIACRAAMTGHRVLTTLHTADTHEVPLRLRDMGVPEYLLDATIRMVVAQRLLRRLCAECRTSRRPTALERGLFSDVSLEQPESVSDPVGCAACLGRGYRGRLAVFEMLTKEPRGGAGSGARSSLKRSGLRRAAVQDTSVAEVLSICPPPRGRP